ncbi:hypothetical protein XENTR_v10017005 [Xenopus tropicalis]|nr:hypothetical protein XENTR_v10017005 [Xenopus tropicalis]
MLLRLGKRQGADSLTLPHALPYALPYALPCPRKRSLTLPTIPCYINWAVCGNAALESSLTVSYVAYLAIYFLIVVSRTVKCYVSGTVLGGKVYSFGSHHYWGRLGGT